MIERNARISFCVCELEGIDQTEILGQILLGVLGAL